MRSNALKDDRSNIYAPVGYCPFWVGVKVAECKGVAPGGRECGYKIESEWNVREGKCSLAKGSVIDKKCNAYPS